MMGDGSNSSSITQATQTNEPRRIVKLSEETINRIAAGEVVQRPASALKELLENSIDAGSTSIKVQVKEGGLKLLSIQDNGSGIKKEDLGLLCERFATSKLKTFEDLANIQTYGFRGEALASISHVAHLTVTTKTRDSPCGYKARYSDGKLVPIADAFKDAEPKMVAANDGTLLLVEDLFYNMPIRRKGLRSPSEEYNRILDVVSKYAIHNAGVAMSLKKIGTSSSDLTTQATATKLEIIGQVYSETVRKELNKLEFENKEFHFSCSGYVSGANYSAKRGTFIFFINHRLVDCTPLKRNLEAFYTNLLPKGGAPFVYLALQIHPHRVDVNVSPTKSEVHFLDQDDVIEIICDQLQQKLSSANQSRTFTVQTLLPGAPAATAMGMSKTSAIPSLEKRSTSSSTYKMPPQKLVRTDANAQTLDTMFARRSAFNASAGSPLKRRASDADDANDADDSAVQDTGNEGITVIPDDDDEEDEQQDLTSIGEAAGSKYRSGVQSSENESAVEQERKPRRTNIPLASCDLTSIAEMRQAVALDKHTELANIIKQHTFVGTVDLDSGYSMLQHGTKLFLVQHDKLCEELFYQLGLRQFGALGKIKLNPPPSLKELLEIGMENEPEAETLPVDQIVQKIHDILISRAAMLEEYFSLTVNPESGTLEAIPLVLPGWAPDLDKLPLFLLRLGAEVDWQTEKGCFETFLRELAFFNSPAPLPIIPGASDGKASPSDTSKSSVERQNKLQEQTWQLKHIVFPAMRYLDPPASLNAQKAVIHVASLENLYKVFERC